MVKLMMTMVTLGPGQFISRLKFAQLTDYFAQITSKKDFQCPPGIHGKKFIPSADRLRQPFKFLQMYFSKFPQVTSN